MVSKNIIKGKLSDAIMEDIFVELVPRIPIPEVEGGSDLIVTDTISEDVSQLDITEFSGYKKYKLNIEFAPQTAYRKAFIKINDVTDANYHYAQYRTYGGIVRLANQNAIDISYSNNNHEFSLDIDIIQRNNGTIWIKCIATLHSIVNDLPEIFINSGLLDSEDIINKLTLFMESGDILSGAKYSLSGVPE